MPEENANVWELLYSSLGFHVEDDAAQGFALRKFCEALCAPMQPAYDLVREREGQAGWAVALDADNAPATALPWLAQFVGVQITPEMDEAQRRAEIRQPTGWRRGQPESIQVAVRRTLTGESPLVIIRPNTPEVGRHYIRTLLSQTPNPTRTAEIVRAAVPAWSVLDYEAITGVSLADLEASKYQTPGELETSPITSVGALEEALPGDL